jgi:site-specific DNA-cytosine methylase
VVAQWSSRPKEAHLLDVDTRRIRRLTVGEVALIQTFPPDYTSGVGLSETEEIKRLGNAVPPVLAKAVFAAIDTPDGESTFIEICAGIGGLASGHLMAHPNAKPLLMADIEPPACKVLRKHFGPDVVVEANVLEYDFSPFAGKCDILCGGPPCQPWSTMGKHKGLEDPRDVIGKIDKLVGVVKPRVFLFENVSGLTTKANLPYLHDIVNRLTRLGYDVAYAVLNAADYGVPQNRKRVFIVGVRDGHGEAAEIVKRWRASASGKPPVTLRQAIGGLPDPGGWKRFIWDLPKGTQSADVNGELYTTALRGDQTMSVSGSFNPPPRIPFEEDRKEAPIRLQDDDDPIDLPAVPDDIYESDDEFADRPLGEIFEVGQGDIMTDEAAARFERQFMGFDMPADEEYLKFSEFKLENRFNENRLLAFVDEQNFELHSKALDELMRVSLGEASNLVRLWKPDENMRDPSYLPAAAVAIATQDPALRERAPQLAYKYLVEIKEHFGDDHFASGALRAAYAVMHFTNFEDPAKWSALLSLSMADTDTQMNLTREFVRYAANRDPGFLARSDFSRFSFEYKDYAKQPQWAPWVLVQGGVGARLVVGGEHRGFDTEGVSHSTGMRRDRFGSSLRHLDKFPHGVVVRSAAIAFTSAITTYVQDHHLNFTFTRDSVVAHLIGGGDANAIVQRIGMYPTDLERLLDMALLNGCPLSTSREQKAAWDHVVAKYPNHQPRPKLYEIDETKRLGPVLETREMRDIAIRCVNNNIFGRPALKQFHYTDVSDTDMANMLSSVFGLPQSFPDDSWPAFRYPWQAHAHEREEKNDPRFQPPFLEPPDVPVQRFRRIEEKQQPEFPRPTVEVVAMQHARVGPRVYGHTLTSISSPAYQDFVGRRVRATQITRKLVAAPDVKDGDVCVICSNTMSPREQCVRFPCGHIVHGDCAMSYIRNACVYADTRVACPVCDRDIPENMQWEYKDFPRYHLLDISQDDTAAIPRQNIQLFGRIVTVDAICDRMNEFEYKAADAKERECALCLVDFVKFRFATVLPCTHIMHADCVRDIVHESASYYSVKQKIRCPSCRAPIPEMLDWDPTDMEPLSVNAAVQEDVRDFQGKYQAGFERNYPGVVFYDANDKAAAVQALSAVRAPIRVPPAPVPLLPIRRAAAVAQHREERKQDAAPYGRRPQPRPQPRAHEIRQLEMRDNRADFSEDVIASPEDSAEFERFQRRIGIAPSRPLLTFLDMGVMDTAIHMNVQNLGRAFEVLVYAETRNLNQDQSAAYREFTAWLRDTMIPKYIAANMPPEAARQMTEALREAPGVSGRLVATNTAMVAVLIHQLRYATDEVTIGHLLDSLKHVAKIPPTVLASQTGSLYEVRNNVLDYVEDVTGHTLDTVSGHFSCAHSLAGGRRHHAHAIVSAY